MRTDALPKLDSKAVSAHIDALSREPFRDLLKRLLQAEPSVEAVQAYSERHPDRWGQLLVMIGRLAGYNDRLEVASSHSVVLAQLSDAELSERLQATLAKLGIQASAGGVIDLKALPKGGNGAGS